jgi:hypothetical protein
MTQTQGTYPTLTLDNESSAYKALKDHYGLKAKQRDLLDASPMLGTILAHAHRGELDVAGGLLVEAGVIDLAQMCSAGE